MRESEVNLYGLNQHFRIDYNWELINPLLTCKSAIIQNAKSLIIINK